MVIRKEKISKNLYKQNDWLLLPTYHPEGFPYVFIEAMRAGIPIITTRNGALERLVTEGVNGYFVKSKNFQTLAQRMKFILEEQPDFRNNCYSYFKNNLSMDQGNLFYSNIMNNN